MGMGMGMGMGMQPIPIQWKCIALAQAGFSSLLPYFL